MCAIAIMATPILAALAPVAVAQTEPLDCDDWNTSEFFEVATADDVMACLAIGADVHARSDDGHTPLHRAAWSNQNPAVIDLLIANGGDVNARREKNGITPLHAAAGGNGNPVIVERLLAAGSELDARDDLGLTPLIFAAESNESVAVIQTLIDAGSDPELVTDWGGSALHFAAANEYPEAMRFFLDLGGDPNSQDDDGRTPLH